MSVKTGLMLGTLPTIANVRAGLLLLIAVVIWAGCSDGTASRSEDSTVEDRQSGLPTAPSTGGTGLASTTIAVADSHPLSVTNAGDLAAILQCTGFLEGPEYVDPASHLPSTSVGLCDFADGFGAIVSVYSDEATRLADDLGATYNWRDCEYIPMAAAATEEPESGLFFVVNENFDIATDGPQSARLLQIVGGSILYCEPLE